MALKYFGGADLLYSTVPYWGAQVQMLLHCCNPLPSMVGQYPNE